MVMVTLDSRGRLSIPAEIRSAMGIESGEVLFLESDPDHKVMYFAKAVNPFDGLGEDAQGQYRVGKTKSLRAYAMEHGIDLNGE